MLKIATEIDLSSKAVNQDYFCELFDLKIKQFYNPAIDNRELKKQRPIYKFLP
jgi:hypothetical protein